MNIRDLTYIRALAKYEHFGQAAESCHVSQPALSSQIKKVEEELGVTLFERDNRSVRLTDVGAEIVELAGDALTIIDSIRARADMSRSPLSGDLSLGSIPTITPYLIPEFVKASRDAMPGLRLTFREDITDRLNEALLNGELDAAILATPPETPKLDAIALYDEPFWVIFPGDHKLHLVKQIRTDDLPIDELLLLTEGHCFRDQALDVCRFDEAPNIRSIRATSLETLVNMVAAHQGITLVPATAINQSWQSNLGVQAEKLDDPAAYRRIYLTFRKSFPRKMLLEKMADLICEHVPDSVRCVR